MKTLHYLLSSIVVVLLFMVSSSHAVKFEISSPLSADNLDRFLLDNVDKIDIETSVLRAEAFEKKIRLALDFEEKLEAHKAELREAGDYIYLLNESRSNLVRIRGLEKELAETERWIEDAREALISRHSDLSIPIAVAGIVEVPIKKDHIKGALFRDNVRNYILNTAGVAWITSEVQFENEELKKELIIESVRGTVEEDTTKTFDHELIERAGGTSKYFTVGFFRYRPFDFGKNMQAASPGGVRAENATVQLINIKDSSKEEIFSEISKRFKTVDSSFQSDLETYLNNILRLEEGVDQSAGRIEYVLNLLNTLKEKQQHRKMSLEQALQRLKEENRKIFSGIGLSYEPDEQAISLLTNQKKLDVEEKRNTFVHHVILMDDFPARNFADGLDQALRSLAKRAAEMVERKSFTAENRVEGQSLTSTMQVRQSRVGQIIEIEIWPYLQGDRVGILFDGELRYPSQEVEEASAGGGTTRGLGFSEDVEGVSIRMLALQPEASGQPTRFISENEVTKAQFGAFDRNSSKFLSRRCVDRLGLRDYPESYSDDYPMLCVNKAGRDGFAAWLSKLTGLDYRVADDAAYNTNFDSKMLSRNSKAFRVFLPSTVGEM